MLTTAKATGSSDFFRAASRKIGKALPPAVTDEEAAEAQVKLWLDKHEVQYADPIDIQMSFIDEKTSRQNQARKEAIVTESVDRYAAAMKAGDVFPPIVGYYKAGKFVIIDGNNRQAAARKAGRDVIRGILIAPDTPSEIITVLMIEANATHGKATDDAWRIEQAFQLLGLGFDMKQAAASVRLNVQQLTTAKAAREFDQRARALKISAGWEDMPKTSKQSLNVLASDEPIFYQATTVAARTGMIGPEIRDFVRDIKALRSERMKLDYIGKVSEERTTRARVQKALGNGRRLSSPSQSLSSAAGKILKIDPAALSRQILTSSDRDNARRYCEDLGNKLLDILSALDTLKDMDADD